MRWTLEHYSEKNCRKAVVMYSFFIAVQNKCILAATSADYFQPTNACTM